MNRPRVVLLPTAGEDSGAWLDTVGQYEDTLVRTADGWRIAARRFRMTRMLSSG